MGPAKPTDESNVIPQAIASFWPCAKTQGKTELGSGELWEIFSTASFINCQQHF
jgi:hypothetical protein